jgi:uncharacterized protein YvpB
MSTISTADQEKISSRGFTLFSTGGILFVLNLLFFSTIAGFFSFPHLPETGSYSSLYNLDESNRIELIKTLLPQDPDQGKSESDSDLEIASTPIALPPEATIENIKGYRQSLPLSCESRSAVDWATYFGTEIEEKAFFKGLPVNDNPEKGFVGDVHGSWGQIPPDPYGVHAEPVAQRLREYGLQAKAVKNMTLNDLQSEIAQGRPVIVWVVGHVARGTPVPYVSSDGELTTVAKFEHTVIVIGYTKTKITVLDGAKVYSVYKGEFLKSWQVLEKQAVVWID